VISKNLLKEGVLSLVEGADYFCFVREDLHFRLPFLESVLESYFSTLADFFLYNTEGYLIKNQK
jgi:hypothetical protein